MKQARKFSETGQVRDPYTDNRKRDRACRSRVRPSPVSDAGQEPPGSDKWGVGFSLSKSGVPNSVKPQSSMVRLLIPANHNLIMLLDNKTVYSAPLYEGSYQEDCQERYPATLCIDRPESPGASRQPILNRSPRRCIPGRCRHCRLRRSYRTPW